MTNYDVLGTAEKVKNALSDVTYYDKDQLELYQRIMNGFINEMVQMKMAAKDA